MKWTAVICIALVSIWLAYMENRHLHHKKERIVVRLIVGTAAILAIVLVFIPSLPSPTDLITLLFAGLNKQLGIG